MKKVIIIVSCFVFHVSILNAQNVDTLSLGFCYKLAVENYPLVKQRELLQQESGLKVNNINTNYYPQVSVNGQATYQSQVTTLPISIPHVVIPILDRDMYNATLNINQLIYDGGTEYKQKIMENKTLDVNKQNLEVELYQLKARVNQLFFNIILLNENQKVLNLLKDNISTRLIQMKSNVKNGEAILSNEDILKAELISNDELRITNYENKEAAIKSLNEFLGYGVLSSEYRVTENTKFILPVISLSSPNMENKRPEMTLYDMQQQMLISNKDIISTKLEPHVYAFGEGGYGRPGLNMLSNQFNSYYMVGAKLSWNIWDWNETNKEKKIIDVQTDIVKTQKEAFDKEVKISVQGDLADMNKYAMLIEKDKDIIELREKIVKSAASQLDNGIITSTDYLIELNSEAQAKLDLETHKIELILAKINYLTRTGQ